MKATKARKFSLGMKIAAILSCLAIASVGFASWWIINYPGEIKYETGSFEVYGVTNKEIIFDGTEGNEIQAVGNANIVFGHPGSGSVTWLGYTSSEVNASTGVKPQNLTAVLKFTIKVKNAAQTGDALSNYIGGLNIKFDAGSYSTLVSTTKYVSAPKVSYRVGGSDDDVSSNFTSVDAATISNFNITQNITEPSATVYLKFEFGWGEATGGQNPYTYFNTKSQGATNPVTQQTEQATAEAMLNAINGLANNPYKVYINTIPKQ